MSSSLTGGYRVVVRSWSSSFLKRYIVAARDCRSWCSSLGAVGFSRPQIVLSWRCLPWSACRRVDPCARTKSLLTRSVRRQPGERDASGTAHREDCSPQFACILCPSIWARLVGRVGDRRPTPQNV